MKKRLTVLLLLCMLYTNIYLAADAEDNTGSWFVDTSGKDEEPYDPFGIFKSQPEQMPSGVQNNNLSSQKNRVKADKSSSQIQQAKAEPKKVTTTMTTTNSANPNVKFMYYIPAKAVQNPDMAIPVIVYVPGLDSDGEECLPWSFYGFADENNFGILTPTFKFDNEDFENEKSYQYPAAWSGQALIRMLNKAKRGGLNYSKLYLVGFSAGAQFSSRFSLIYPEMVEACAILASGARVKPEKKTDVKYFIGIGTMDDEFRLKNAEIFVDAARNLGIPLEYKQYMAGHETPDEEYQDVLNFFKRVHNNSF